MLMAVLEASRYIDDVKNRPAVAKLIADKRMSCTLNK